VQETEKRLWFCGSYPDKEPYYCKTRWKPKQRERIAAIPKNNTNKTKPFFIIKDGTVDKIVDNFTTFHTQYFIMLQRTL